ncbi:CCA tRNA nucleotidyltransferase [Chengkuizengella sediminis]|uniref:CCA tRNA nucleotidyltransferase n=1 Tax=Chengkuizengella sediminis TaxID=1885917 RepID=UPI0013898E13|nr:CCA tRNA nucleotidyltransferase [Chengkuizengella sediminis]NDI34386.1 CCA tRNA nucleotidyltransferase [Chengkuizengella sediminis]
MNDLIIMEQEASEVISELEKHGYEAYYVGGYVRDKFLNRNIKDIDITTSAYPSIVMDIFSHTVPTGLQHGTVTVVMRNYHFEVTTYRTESEYEDHRRPKEVRFVSKLMDDLERRDFTMNAMAIDINGTIIDPFGGKRDLSTKILKCVGDPLLRFSEDALRMMRAIRFAAEYDLQVEQKTWNAILLHKEEIKHIAMERISAELDKMMEGSNPKKGVQLLIASELMNYTKENLQIHKTNWLALSDHSVLNVFEHIHEGTIRWILLLMLLKTETSQMTVLLKKLKFSNHKIMRIHVVNQVKDCLNEQNYSESSWKKAVIMFGVDAVKDLHTLLNALAIDQHYFKLLPFKMSKVDLDHILQKGLDWIDEIPIMQIRELEISGTDVVGLKSKSGPWIRIVLNQLLTEVALNELENKQEDLMNRAIQIVRGMNEYE